MKQIRITARILIGLVFIFSGFVKGVDPMGSAIKFTEYFEVFHLGGLESISLALAIILSTAEFIIGISLVVGLRMRVTAWAALLFMVFFTLLTLYSAIANPVTDCGCFGDALVLTNWQTFYKNVVLLALAVVVFINHSQYKPYSCCLAEWGLVALFAACMVSISVYGVRHLPILDFRPYHVGANIPSDMVIPEGAPAPVYESTLYYKKNGVTKEFSLQNFPANDTTWQFVDSKSKLIKEGYIPPIRNFSIVQEDGLDITEQVLSDNNYSFIFISPDLRKVSFKAWEKIKGIQKFAEANGYKFYFLTGSTQDMVVSLKTQWSLNFSFSFTDVTTLKTINRANPGMMLLKEGTILGQWNVLDIPKAEIFKGNMLSAAITKYYKEVEQKRILLLLSLLILSFVTIWFCKRRDKCCTQ
jgi:uncharacterized membrane protein YphA (DoxX/SURF4 family)